MKLHLEGRNYSKFVHDQFPYLILNVHIPVKVGISEVLPPVSKSLEDSIEEATSKLISVREFDIKYFVLA